MGHNRHNHLAIRAVFIEQRQNPLVLESIYPRGHRLLAFDVNESRLLVGLVGASITSVAMRSRATAEGLAFIIAKVSLNNLRHLDDRRYLTRKIVLESGSLSLPHRLCGLVCSR